jgi:septum formation protein
VGWLGVPVDVTAVETPEDITVDVPPARLAADLAAEKAQAARAQGAEDCVLAFDTIVVVGDEVLGKPRDREEARQMLQRLAGGTHDVVTGVAILPPGASYPSTFAVVTPVRMRELSAETMEAWVTGDEVLGCAGAYNIEHHLASVADDQCFHNVAGMPLCHLYRELSAGGLVETPEGLTAPVTACDAALGRRCLLGPTLCELP